MSSSTIKLLRNMRFKAIIRISLLFYCVAIGMGRMFCQERGVSVSNDSANTIRGKTYALIIGISKYETFPSLQYADRDASAFYEFIKSKGGGLVDSANIYYKTNEGARAGDLWRGMTWLERRADSVGETAIIYFSGHGDAANAVEAYLLAYDAPNEGDPNLYNMGGTFQIYNIKVKVKQMVSKGVKVILITDACRNNDLPEAGNQWIFQSITEEKSGEIQMISCSGNEQSLEDTKWGNGRGVFSFHLVNGLKGMADSDPRDGRVTLYELERYVRDRVRSDTRATAADQPRQNPVFCCPEKNEMVLSTVDTLSTAGGGNAYKRQNLLQVDPLVKGHILAAFLKDYEAGAHDQLMTSRASRDSLFDHYYKLFTQAINKKELIAPKGKSAADYLDLLLPMANDPLVKEDLYDEMVAALMNEAQTGITNYGRPPILDTVDALNYAFFNDRALLLDAALKYATHDEKLKKEITARKLVLEARALVEKGGSDELALSKVDSSLSIMNTSYGNHTKGLLLAEMDKKEEAIQYFDKAAGPEKKWAYPLSAKGDVYRSGGNYDSAVLYYKKALSLNPANDNTVFKLGVAYQEKGQYDSSIVYLQKASNIRNKSLGKQNYNSANTINYLARAYDKKGDNTTAEYLYKEAIGVYQKMPGKEHTYYANTLTNLAGLYDKIGKNEVAKPLYQQATVIKQNTPARGTYKAQRQRVDERPYVNQKAPDIDAEGMANLLLGVSAGKRTAADFAPYLCDDQKTMVRFNKETMTFASMFRELTKSKRIKDLKAVLKKDQSTNCILGMEVTTQKMEPSPKTAPDINAEGMARLLSGIASGKTTAEDFKPYLCDKLRIMVNLNNKPMTFAEMYKLFRDKGKDMSTPKLRLTKDPTTNCVTGMDVIVKRNPSTGLQPSSPDLNNVPRATQTTPSRTQVPLNTQESIRKN